MFIERICDIKKDVAMEHVTLKSLVFNFVGGQLIDSSKFVIRNDSVVVHLSSGIVVSDFHTIVDVIVD